VNVGHPALLPVPLLTPNNEENNENPDQTYQKELAHETALCFSGIRTLLVGSSGYKQDRGGEQRVGEYLGTCRALINRDLHEVHGQLARWVQTDLWHQVLGGSNGLLCVPSNAFLGRLSGFLSLLFRISSGQEATLC